MCLSLRKKIYLENKHSLSIFLKILKMPYILMKFSTFKADFMEEDEFWNFFHYFFHDQHPQKHKKKNYRRSDSKQKVQNRATLLHIL